MRAKILFSFPGLMAISCCNPSFQPPTGFTAPVIVMKDTAINTNPYPLVCSIPLPNGFTRLKADSNSFAFWLKNVHLKKDKQVHLYDGSLKENQTAQFAVLDMPVGNKDLQQCADAVMHLRAQYLFDNKRFNEISFTDNEGGIYKFDQPYTIEHFNKYLEKVYGMCGTASLSKELKSKKIEDIQQGDVLIRGGFPGHAVIVMDVAVNTTGKKIYLLAQSYMPAQEIHILNNPQENTLSPWYEVNDNDDIVTPEYWFKRNELKQW